MIRILFQGDSITDGNRYKDEERRWDLNHQIGHSYAFIIAATLGRGFPGKYHFINRGVSGDSVQKIAARWERDTLAENPDVLSLLCGINENGSRNGIYAEGVEAHLSDFEATYREILRLAREKNPALKIIIIEPFYLPVKSNRDTYSAFMRVFERKQEIIKRIAADFGAVFIPVQERLSALVREYGEVLKDEGRCGDPNEYWLWDGIHPTEAMHGFLAELWLDAVRGVL